MKTHRKIFAYYDNSSCLCDANKLNVVFMKREITEEEFDLLEAIRNYRKSKHNPSWQLEEYAQELFNNLMYDFDDYD